MTTYYDRFLHQGISAHCAGCNRTLRLHEFRKWWGSKRLLRTLCRKCEPEKSLKDMTPEERLTALDNQRAYVTPLRVEKLNEADRIAKRMARSGVATKIKKSERLRSWALVLRLLRDERAWCRRNQVTPASEEWEDFFKAYEVALTNALYRLGLIKSKRTPSEAEAQPGHWLYPETCARLREMYSRCPVVRGRRLYRDPGFLEWRANAQ